MNLTKRERKIKYFVYCLLIIFAGFIQCSGGNWLEIGNAKCFFLIPFSVALGIDEDERVSAFIGFCAGLIWDAFSLSHMGFNCIFLMLACYISSSLVSYLIRSTYWVTVLSCLVAVDLYSIVYWLMFVVADGGDGALQSLGFFYIPCMLYTSVVTLGIVAILRPIKKSLNKQTIID